MDEIALKLVPCRKGDDRLLVGGDRIFDRHSFLQLIEPFLHEAILDGTVRPVQHLREKRTEPGGSTSVHRPRTRR